MRRCRDSEQGRFGYVVLYDEQCEICQAGVTWLHSLDPEARVRAVPISRENLESLNPSLILEACSRELHVLGPGGIAWRGGAAVRKLARLFPATWLLGAVLGIPPLSWLSDLCYRWVSGNRHQLSRCRGGTCRATPEAKARRPGWRVFWGCYLLGLLLRTPLVFLSALGSLVEYIRTTFRVRSKTFRWLGGKFQVSFLGGFPSDLGPLLFGEQFWMIHYDGLLIDPGGPRMARSVRRALARVPAGSVEAVVATHGHEEHVGNLGLVARITGAPVRASRLTADIVRTGPRLPRMRALIIGQPEPYGGEIVVLSDTIQSRTSTLQVLPAPGHCDDHVILYDPKEKVLISGDAFVSTYFSSPNPDVDSRKWLESLEQLASMDIAILITGHGTIYTLRTDIPDVPGVVVRKDPQECIREKLGFMRWLRGQVEEGIREAMPARVIEATLFPWTRIWSWENLFSDELARLLSGGEFSRSELVRTFVRNSGSAEPEVYALRGYC